MRELLQVPPGWGIVNISKSGFVNHLTPSRCSDSRSVCNGVHSVSGKDCLATTIELKHDGFLVRQKSTQAFRLSAFLYAMVSSLPRVTNHRVSMTSDIMLFCLEPDRSHDLFILNIVHHIRLR
jgi:hypothetical protein